ncbi:MAG: type II toxin-antitoxin system RelE/ParE family toxin [Anaerolineales bacterium]|nr:type II toxin-antitoxin system RelE/ParE family toxin [Anaerolineales bacterium]
MASYRVEVTQQVHKEIRNLPGNVRQRVTRILQALQQESLPGNSRLLDLSKIKLELTSDLKLCRIRLDSWRIVYVIEEELNLISVLAIRQRPPYQYDDLAELIKNIQP